jgi:hypothetical protein
MRTVLVAVVGAAVAAVAGLTVGVSAQQIDMAAIARWRAVKVVHYRMVGTFQGAVPLPGSGGYGEVKVSDGITVDLDWDATANKVIGEVRFVNTPSKVAGTTPGHATTCAPPVLNGPFELFEVGTASPHQAGVELKGTRTVPAAMIPTEYPTTCAPKSVAGSSETLTEVIAVPSPLMLVMPTGANPNMSVAADRKSFTVKHKDWTWTYTPTVVK